MVDTDPAPIPTRTASTPASSRANAWLRVTTFPPITSTLGYLVLMCRICRVVRLVVRGVTVAGSCGEPGASVRSGGGVGVVGSVAAVCVLSVSLLLSPPASVFSLLDLSWALQWVLPLYSSRKKKKKSLPDSATTVGLYTNNFLNIFFFSTASSFETVKL